MGFTNEKPKVEKPARKILGSAIVNADKLNVRKQPAATAPVLKIVNRGERFNVTEGSNKQFTALIIDDEVAYAMTQYLQVTMN